MTLNPAARAGTLGMIAAHASCGLAGAAERGRDIRDGALARGRNPYAGSPLLANNQVLAPPPPGVVASRREPKRSRLTRRSRARPPPSWPRPRSDGDEPRGAPRSTPIPARQPRRADGLRSRAGRRLAGFGLALLLAPKATDMKDANSFHIITLRQMNMPSVTPARRRARSVRAIAHVRALQRSGRDDFCTPSTPSPACCRRRGRAMRAWCTIPRGRGPASSSPAFASPQAWRAVLRGVLNRVQKSDVGLSVWAASLQPRRRHSSGAAGLALVFVRPGVPRGMAEAGT